MTWAEALALLRLSDADDAGTIDEALRGRVADVQERLEHAPAGALRTRYQDQLRELRAAARTLGRPMPEPAPAGETAGGAVAGQAVQKGWKSARPQPTAPARRRSLPRWIPIVLVAAVSSMGATWLLNRPRAETDGATGIEFSAPRGSAVAYGRTEVTQSQFARFVQTTGYVTDAERTGRCLVYTSGTGEPRSVTWRSAFGSAPDAPVVCVSWNDASAYARWATAATGTAVRLPSRDEWTRLAAAGARGIYSFGEDVRQLGRHGNTASRESPFPWAAQVSVGDDSPGLSTVARYRANAWGLYDVHGNVWEWTDEAFSPTQRVIRGGGWASHPANATLTARNALGVDEAANDTGFRVIRLRN